jgi:hypothetical protein
MAEMIMKGNWKQDGERKVAFKGRIGVLPRFQRLVNLHVESMTIEINIVS